MPHSRWFAIGAVLLLLCLCTSHAGRSRSPVLATEADALALRARVQRTIQDTQTDADRIIQAVLNGSAHHQAWNRLAEFTDTIGHRLSGTDSFVQGVEWIQQRMIAEGLDNVHQEIVQVPLWLRGEESVTLLEPRVAKLNMLGLGNSVAGNLTADVLVVRSFDELKQQAAAGNTTGKIILFNHQCDWKSRPTDCYSDTIDYREEGPSAASRVGAVATLVKSLAAFSINSPHTGTTDYDSDVVQIPAAAITLEDAEMLQRMQDRGQRVVVNVLMSAKSYGNVPQPNLVAEIVGSDFPDEVVLVSGHLDSWDPPTGSTGAMDDGGGAFISWQALSLFRSLGITPRRTIRFVGWACEEFGGIGAQQYYDLHKGNISNMDFVMESDAGVFRAYGIRFSGSAAAQAIVQQLIASLLTPINATTLVVGGGGEDIDPWQEAGVPGASLANHNERYFWFHHSGGDTMSVLDPDEVDSAAITWAVTALAVANLDDLLPRNSQSAPQEVLAALRQPLPSAYQTAVL